jgi:hypothetical protein
MHATTIQNPALESAPKTKGKCLTWEAIKALPKGTYLATDESPTYFYGIYISQRWDKGHVLRDGILVDRTESPNFKGDCGQTNFRLGFRAVMSDASPLRLATQTEIRKAKREHLKAWRKAWEARQKELSEAYDELLRAERAAGLHVPLPE